MILTAGARRRTARPLPAATAPFDSFVQCVTPTYDGSGQVTHPSVVDMGGLWNGYRWWLADTPYPNGNDDYENPSIWGSNDRINWSVPSGLTNPIAPMPSGTGFNSDVDLVWDADGERLICYWREAASASPTVIDIRAATSTDGIVWTHQGVIHTFSGEPWRSPSVARVAANDWRMWAMDNNAKSVMYSATDPLGTWGEVGNMTVGGRLLKGWHGDFTYEDGVYYGIAGTTGRGPFIPYVSIDGLTWYAGPEVFGDGYRSTMLPPRDGFVEVWYSKQPAMRDYWTRIPASCWTDLLPQ